MRNVIAIIGSAGKLSDDLRKQVEELSSELSRIGFDLVTGGMGGVMRAVARGHHGSSGASKLTHVDPGWGLPWRDNPFDAAFVRTELGSMRNHLIIRSSDLVIAISGGSGTLSEIAIAWQEGKPIATLGKGGGWAQKLGGESLDHRREDTITACSSIDELLDWATEQRPAGVFTGRENRGFYPFEVPTIHRIHQNEAHGSHSVHLQHGMSIQFESLVGRLEELNDAAKTWDDECLAMVSFDDGWADVLLLEETFDRLTNLKPVLFIPESLFSEEVHPLPLQRLYQHLSEHEENWEGIRSEIKSLTEEEAHSRLDELGVSRMLNPAWLLNLGEISRLSSKGWVIASHGHQHEDLTKGSNLLESLERLADTIEIRGDTPWLAWPEGRWSSGSFRIAMDAGFSRQFGLLEEPHEDPIPGMVLRKIWK